MLFRTINIIMQIACVARFCTVPATFEQVIYYKQYILYIYIYIYKRGAKIQGTCAFLMNFHRILLQCDVNLLQCFDL